MWLRVLLVAGAGVPDSPQHSAHLVPGAGVVGEVLEGDVLRHPQPEVVIPRQLGKRGVQLHDGGA